AVVSFGQAPANVQGDLCLHRLAAGCVLVFPHGSLVARHVNTQAALPSHLLRQVWWETKSCMEAENEFAINHRLLLRFHIQETAGFVKSRNVTRVLKELKTSLNRSEKIRLLTANDVHDPLRVLLQLRECAAHMIHQRQHQFIDERLALIETLPP